MSIYLATHPQVQALLQAAKEAPEADTPRLVLADWLEDHGDPDRAEFIRLQLRHASQDATKHLLDRHGGAWLGPLWHLCLSPLAWNRGLLSVGLSRRIAPDSILDALPWIDTLLCRIFGWQGLEHVGQLLSRTSLNHVYLDLRTPLRESRLLDLLAALPEDTCLRSLSWHWPLGMLARLDQPRTTPVVSEQFLTRLLHELPVSRHLTYLASSTAWTAEQQSLIQGLGVEPIHANQRLWMHSLPASRFQRREVFLRP
jgi:uncharacterized protein (TIGR02996 family)